MDGIALSQKKISQSIKLTAKRRRLGQAHKVLDGAPAGAQNYGRVVVRHPALWFRVDTDQVEALPHQLEQLVHVPAVFGADGHRVWNAKQEVELLDADGIDLVEHVYDWHVAPALRLKHVDDVVDGGVAPDGNVS